MTGTRESRRRIRQALLAEGFKRIMSSEPDEEGGYNEGWVHTNGDVIDLHWATASEPPSKGGMEHYAGEVITDADLRDIQSLTFSEGDVVTVIERGDLEGDISGVWIVNKVRPASDQLHWTEPRYRLRQGEGVHRRYITNTPQSALRLHDPMAEHRGATDEQLAAAGHTDETPCPGCTNVVSRYLEGRS